LKRNWITELKNPGKRLTHDASGALRFDFLATVAVSDTPEAIANFAKARIGRIQLLTIS